MASYSAHQPQIQPRRWLACAIRVTSKGWKKLLKHLSFQNFRAGEIDQSVKCLPCKEEDLILIPRIDTALVIPGRGRQRQVDLWSSLVGQSSFISNKLVRPRTSWPIFIRKTGVLRESRNNTKNDTKRLFPHSQMSLKMTRERSLEMTRDRPDFRLSR